MTRTRRSRWPCARRSVRGRFWARSAAIALLVGVLVFLPAISPPLSATSAGRREADASLRGRSVPATPSVWAEASADLANRTVGWSQITSPPAGFGVNGGLAADTVTGTAFAFGGEVSTGLVNSTFAYDESTNQWSAVPGSVAPSPRSDFSLAFDSTIGVGALFGGITNLSTLTASNQTWEIGATGAWTRESVGSAPPAREAAAFAIDPSLGVGLLYGGWNQSYSPTAAITYSDLWKLNLTTWAWTQVAVSGVRPPPLEGASMVWDPIVERFLLFGGCYPCSSTVWEFNLTSATWEPLPVTPASPPARGAAVWAFDPALGAELLFGGTAGAASLNTTYLFYPSNNSWVPQTLLPHPQGRYDAASGFLDVPDNETLLVAGGLSVNASFDDLWRLSTTSDLSLHVVNATNLSRPLNGVRVNLSGREVGVTNLSGYLNLTQVNGVDQPLALTDDPWYFPQNRTLWEAPGQASDVQIALTPEPLGSVNVTVDSTIGGPVFNASTNLTIDGVRVNGVPHLTNIFGNASFYGVPPGRLNVSASMPDWRLTYLHTSMPPSANLSEQLVLTPDPVLTVLALGNLPSQARVALGGAAVILNGVNVGATTSSGEFSGPTDAYGLSNVVVYVFGFVTAGVYVDIPWTGPVMATLVLTSLPYATLAVTVASNKTFLPIQDATVTAAVSFPLAFGYLTQTVSTDINGVVSLSLPEGTYTLSAVATGYNRSSPDTLYDLGPGENTSATILLDPIPPATVHFRVLDNSTHRPIPGASVTTTNGLPTELSNVHGYCNFSGLLPGTYIFELDAAGYIPNSTDLTLVSYENITVEVNLTLAPLVAIPGVAGWTFNLFPGSLDELWPFLAAPAFLVLGAFVYSSVRRAGAFEANEPTRPRPPRKKRRSRGRAAKVVEAPPPSPPDSPS